MKAAPRTNPDSLSVPADMVAIFTRPQWALLLAPFYLNDLANIWLHDPVWWLLQDYGCRLVILGCLVFQIRRHRWAAAIMRVQAAPWPTLVLWTVSATAGALVLIPGPGSLLLTFLPETRLGSVPEIPGNGLHLLDLTAGLALVSLTEELVFRGALQVRLALFFRSEVAGVIAASVLFGLIHWSNGVGSVIQTTLVGLWFGLCVRRSRSLIPVIVAHYVADMLVFL